MLPSAEHPEPKSEVLERIVLCAALCRSCAADSSQTMVALPAPTA